MNDSLLRWPLGDGVALALIAFAWRFLVADPLLFVGARRRSLSVPAGRAFAATLTVLGLVTFAAGVGSALTVRGLDEG